MLRLFIALLVVIFPLSSAFPQTQPAPAPPRNLRIVEPTPPNDLRIVEPTRRPVPDKSVKEAFSVMQKLVRRQNYRELGFESPEEVRSATLGVPTAEYFVRLDELRGFGPGGSADRLLHQTGRENFPVLVGTNVRSSLVLAKRKGKWKTESVGSPQYARLLSSVRSETASRDGRNPQDYFEVKVPALNLFFLGSRQNGRLFLTPLHDSPRLNLNRGVTKAADEVLRSLVPLAQSHNGLPS